MQTLHDEMFVKIFLFLYKYKLNAYMYKGHFTLRSGSSL